METHSKVYIWKFVFENSVDDINSIKRTLLDVVEQCLDLSKKA